jgi:ribosomal-protein-alanine N-acetyltransferase
MTILPMTLSDAPQVAELEKSCFPDPWSEKSFRDEAENPLACYLTARENGIITGYIGMHTVLDEGHITNIAVSPAHRRKAIAKKLIAALISHAKAAKLSFLTLEVRERNVAAINLYTNFGFKRAGLRARYYTNPAENALLMTLILNTN